ncbi:MAG: hypothetical protein IKN04_21075 [Clostridia bacterium]|nr:hypothetical protein [Clostridia bacterium]
MRVRLAIVGLVLMLVVTTVALQMAVFGNYEEMVELEYEEYQIKFDYDQMARGILNLFGHHTGRGRKQHSQQSEKAPSSDTQNGNSAPTLQTAPTAPTLQTLNTTGGGQ